MSRPMLGAHFSRRSFPRVSGDEPAITLSPSATEMFSPRERG